MAAFKKTYKSKFKIEKGSRIEKILSNSVSNYTFDARKNIKELSKEVKTQVRDNENLLQRLANMPLLSEKEADAIATLGKVQTLSICKKAMDDLRNAMQKLESKKGSVYELDHLTMEPVMQAVSMLIIGYQQAYMDMKGGKKFTDTQIGVNYTPGDMTTNPFKPSAANLEVKIDYLQKLRLYYSLWKQKGMNKNFDFLKAAEPYMKGGTIDIDYIKENDLSIDNPGRQARIQILATTKHKEKSDKQLPFGDARVELLSGKKARDEFGRKVVQDIKNAGAMNIVGSPHIGNTIIEQLADKVQGKRIKRKRSYTRRRIKSEKIPKAAPARLVKHFTTQTKQEVLQAAAILGTKVQLAGKRRRKDTGDLQKELNRIRAVINRKLPAQVRENMGRPALENQTGRFSNSVQLLRLREAGKTIMGEYSYLLTPYETFENTGEQDWPNAYNPKDLITKSIRDLAPTVTDKKFTFRLFRV